MPRFDVANKVRIYGRHCAGRHQVEMRNLRRRPDSPHATLPGKSETQALLWLPDTSTFGHTISAGQHAQES